MTAELGDERIDAADGAGSFHADCSIPPSGSGPGILLFQEIFGINDMLGDESRKVGRTETQFNEL